MATEDACCRRQLRKLGQARFHRSLWVWSHHALTIEDFHDDVWKSFGKCLVFYLKKTCWSLFVTLSGSCIFFPRSFSIPRTARIFGSFMLSKKALTNESWNAYLKKSQVVFLRISEPSTVPHESRELPMPSNAKSPVYPPWNVHNQPRIRYRHKRAQETEKRDRRSSCRNLLGRLVLKWWGCLLYDSTTTPPYSNLPKIYFNYSSHAKIKRHKVLHMYFRCCNGFLNDQ